MSVGVGPAPLTDVHLFLSFKVSDPELLNPRVEVTVYDIMLQGGRGLSFCAVPREIDCHGDVVSTMDQLLMFHGNDR